MSGTLRLRGSTSGYAELQAAAVAGDQTFILPAVGGTLLTTDSPVGNLTLELGSASQPSLRFEGDTDTGLFSSGANTLNLVTGGSNKLVLGATAHTIFSGANGSVRALDIDGSGRLLIGMTSAPAGTDAQYAKFALRGNTLNTNSCYLSLGNGKSTADTTSDDNLGIITFNDSDTDAGEYARIIGASDGANGTDDYPGKLIFSTTEDGGSSPTPRLTISSTGSATFTGNIQATKPRSSTAGSNTGGLCINPSDSTVYFNFRVDEVDNALHIDTVQGADKFLLGTDGSATIDGSVLIGTTTSNGAKFKVSDGGAHEFAFFPDDSGVNSLVNYNRSGGGAYVDMSIAAKEVVVKTGTSPTTAVYVDSSRRVLVGIATSPTSGSGQYGKLVSAGNTLDATGDGRIILARGKDVSQLSNGNDIGGVYYTDSLGNTFASIKSSVDNVPGANDFPGNLSFNTTPNDLASPTSRMIIDSEGTTTFLKKDNNTEELLFGYGSTSGIYAGIGGKNNFNTDQLCDLLFYTNGSTSSRSPQERMRIASNGTSFFQADENVIGAMSEASAGTTVRLYYGSYSSTGISGTVSYTVWTNGNVVNTNNSYGSLSDAKLKENIVDANSQWNDLKAIQVRNYNFIEGQTHTQIGVVAQEVETVSPGLVSESPDRDEEGNDLGTTTKSVNYSVLYMKAVKALQEAMERIENLETRIATLENN
jgi:hypothetical protein